MQAALVTAAEATTMVPLSDVIGFGVSIVGGLATTIGVLWHERGKKDEAHATKLDLANKEHAAEVAQLNTAHAAEVAQLHKQHADALKEQFAARDTLRTEQIEEAREHAATLALQSDTIEAIQELAAEIRRQQRKRGTT